MRQIKRCVVHVRSHRVPVHVNSHCVPVQDYGVWQFRKTAGKKGG
jgi:hypothetical protein